MTSEEKAVIQAAIAWRDGLDPIRFMRIVGDPSDVLLNAVNALTRDKSEWVLATWQHVVELDRVRLPGRPETEAVVSQIIVQDRHTKTRQYRNGNGELRDWVEPWEHEVIHVRLTGRAAPLDWPPAEPVEILMDFDRRSVFGVQQMFARKDES